MLLDIFASTFLGALSALGIGGGSLLILWLTLVREFAFPAAKYINLLFFLPPAILGCIAKIKQQNTPPSCVIAAAVSSCSTAAFFSVISSAWDTSWIKRLFGILLIVASIRELRFRVKK